MIITYLVPLIVHGRAKYNEKATKSDRVAEADIPGYVAVERLLV